jgi:hypothetical protein
MHSTVVARKLKDRWIQRAKIRSQWNAEKKHLRTDNSTAEGEQQEIEPEDSTHDTATTLDTPHTSGSCQTQTPNSTKTTSSRSQTMRPSIRELAREVYSQPSRRSTNRPHNNHASSSKDKKKSQPNMKLKMNLLLEQIKQKHAS